jgi:hypothetical protein
MRRKITRTYRNVNVPKGRKLQTSFIPSFKEFVKYIVDENSSQNTPEMHWAPVYNFCNPCQVQPFIYSADDKPNCHSFKGCLTKFAELLTYVFTIFQLLSIRSSKKNASIHHNSWGIMGVDTRILKIR